ncbi:MAG: hypothetical protein HY701_11550 [Gemmatimonadetes bacterium]|nr:hypothetical protein [Gemmatimonadota bacterium]
MTLPILFIAFAAACQEKTPTGLDAGDLFPVTARTAEIRVPAADFLREIRVFSGFGSPAELGQGLVARNFGGALEARTLARLLPYPTSAQVRDSAGTTLTDTLFTILKGRVVVVIDTTEVVGSGPLTLAAATLSQPWHAPSATWTNALDTVGTRIAWAEPGAGPALRVGTAAWDRAKGDSVFIPVDSATVMAWRDTTRAERSVRIDALSEGVRAAIESVTLQVEVRPSVRRDTTVFINVGTVPLSFIYDPPPPSPSGELRVGGTPAWRSVLVLDLPREFGAGHPVCARLPCPVVLDTLNLTSAALVLRTRASPPGFQPATTSFFDIRPVLSPQRLPKAPLLSTLNASPTQLEASAFLPGGRKELVIPVTRFVRDHLRPLGPADDPVPNTVAILSAVEPRGFGIASFAAEGADAPELRLIVTITEPLRLP